MNNAESHPCPICQSERTKFLFESWDFYHGYPGTFPLWRCNDCGHIQVIQNFSPDDLTDMYSNYYPRSQFDIESWKPYQETKGFIAWLDGDTAHCHRWVPKNVKVLDIGCGYCETLGYHQARGCEVWGCEADTNSQKIAERYGFKNFKNGLFDSDDYPQEYFDYVTMNQVVEHLSNPQETLRQVNKVLKPGGKVIVAMPDPVCIERYCFGRLWGGWHIPYHLHLFSKRSAKILFEQTGFRFEKTVCRTPSHILLNMWATLFIHGKPGQPMKFRTAQMTATENLGSEAEKLWYVRLYRLLEKIRPHAYLQRLSDVLNAGTSRLYFAEKR